MTGELPSTDASIRPEGGRRGAPNAAPLTARALVAAALPWILGALAFHLVVLLLETQPPRATDGAFVRWLRVFPDHPVRVPLALGLLLFALRPPRASPPP